PRTPLERMDRIVALTWLSEAAMRMAAGDQDAAKRRLDNPPLPSADAPVTNPNSVFPARPSAPPTPMPPPGPGGPGGPGGMPGFAPGSAPSSFLRDGEFAVAFEQSGHNLEDKMKMIRALRDSASTDLGPLDADAF